MFKDFFLKLSLVFFINYLEVFVSFKVFKYEKVDWIESKIIRIWFWRVGLIISGSKICFCKIIDCNGVNEEMILRNVFCGLCDILWFFKCECYLCYFVRNFEILRLYKYKWLIYFYLGCLFDSFSFC